MSKTTYMIVNEKVAGAGVVSGEVSCVLTRGDHVSISTDRRVNQGPQTGATYDQNLTFRGQDHNVHLHLFLEGGLWVEHLKNGDMYASIRGTHGDHSSHFAHKALKAALIKAWNDHAKTLTAEIGGAELEYRQAELEKAQQKVNDAKQALAELEKALEAATKAATIAV